MGLMKDELSGKIIKGFVQLRAKAYSYIKQNNDEYKKKKAQKRLPLTENFNFKVMKTV